MESNHPSVGLPRPTGFEDLQYEGLFIVDSDTLLGGSSAADVREA